MEIALQDSDLYMSWQQLDPEVQVLDFFFLNFYAFILDRCDEWGGAESCGNGARPKLMS